MLSRENALLNIYFASGYATTTFLSLQIRTEEQYKGRRDAIYTLKRRLRRREHQRRCQLNSDGPDEHVTLFSYKENRAERKDFQCEILNNRERRNEIIKMCQICK